MSYRLPAVENGMAVPVHIYPKEPKSGPLRVSALPRSLRPLQSGRDVETARMSTDG